MRLAMEWLIDCGGAIDLLIDRKDTGLSHVRGQNLTVASRYSPLPGPRSFLVAPPSVTQCRRFGHTARYAKLPRGAAVPKMHMSSKGIATQQ